MEGVRREGRREEGGTDGEKGGWGGRREVKVER